MGNTRETKFQRSRKKPRTKRGENAVHRVKIRMIFHLKISWKPKEMLWMRTKNLWKQSNRKKKRTLI